MTMSRMRTLVLVFLSAAVFTVVPGEALMAQAAQATIPVPQTKALRPANVPRDFVLTPFGYFNPTCVHTLSKGDSQRPDGQVQHADGRLEGSATCTYSHYMKDGTELKGGLRRSQADAASGKAQVDPSASEDANITSAETQPYGGLHGFYLVPDAPRVDEGQTLFYWQGLEDADTGATVIQPVLTWYAGQWNISGWNCCTNGNVNQSQPVDVSPRDVIYSSLTNNCPAGTVVCPTWDVLIVDVTTGKSSLLADTPSFGQAFSWAFGAFLEPYAYSCADYPRDRQLTFWDVTLLDTNLKPIRHPHWTGDWSAQSSCPFKVTIDTPRDITLSY